MLTREEDIYAHAFHRQGRTISAIARHLGRDRKTIRGYLAGACAEPAFSGNIVAPMARVARVPVGVRRPCEEPWRAEPVSVAMKKSPLVARSRSPLVAR